MADFDGRSSLLYRFNQKSMSTVKDVISLRFKSRQAEGVLLHGEGQRGDYITLELHHAKLALYLNLGESLKRNFTPNACLTCSSDPWVVFNMVALEFFRKDTFLPILGLGIRRDSMVHGY